MEGEESTKETKESGQRDHGKVRFEFAGLGHSPQSALSFHLATPHSKASID